MHPASTCAHMYTYVPSRREKERLTRVSVACKPLGSINWGFRAYSLLYLLNTSRPPSSQNYELSPTKPPTLKCTLTDSQCAFTLTHTATDGQEYTFIAMPDAILGQHCSVIKAVRSSSGAASNPVQLTFKAPIQF